MNLEETGRLLFFQVGQEELPELEIIEDSPPTQVWPPDTDLVNTPSTTFINRNNQDSSLIGLGIVKMR